MSEQEREVSLRWQWLLAVRRAKLGKSGEKSGKETDEGTSKKRGGRGSIPAVALALGTFGNADGTNVHPGQERLARELGLSRKSVERALEVLEDRGFITKVGAASFTKGWATEYRLTLPQGFATLSDEGLRHSDEGFATLSSGVCDIVDEGLRHFGVDNVAPQVQDRVTTQGTYTGSSTQKTEDTDENPWAGLDEAEIARRHEQWVKQHAAERESAAEGAGVLTNPWAGLDDDEEEVERQPLERIDP